MHFATKIKTPLGTGYVLAGGHGEITPGWAGREFKQTERNWWNAKLFKRAARAMSLLNREHVLDLANHFLLTESELDSVRPELHLLNLSAYEVRLVNMLHDTIIYHLTGKAIHYPKVALNYIDIEVNVK